MAAQLNDPLSTRARMVDDNKYYVAELMQASTGLSFRAFVPETFVLSIQNHWEPLFGTDGSSTPVARIGQALGQPVSLKYLSRRVWTGTEPLEFDFTFLLDAYSSTFSDVQQPIINLLKMSTPKRSGAFLKAPGPTMISDTDRIYLRIGKFFVLDSVVINNVQLTFYTIADRADGRYMSADINVNLSSAYTPDQDDILRYFENGQSGNNELAEGNRVPEAVQKIGKEIEAAQEKLKEFGNSLGDGIGNVFSGGVLGGGLR